LPISNVGIPAIFARFSAGKAHHATFAISLGTAHKTRLKRAGIFKERMIFGGNPDGM
jgi:hypothetical protein